MVTPDSNNAFSATTALSGGAWQEVVRVNTRGRAGRLIFDGVVSGGNPLEGLKIVQQVYSGVDRDVFGASAGDWATANVKVQLILPTGGGQSTTASGSWFHVEVEVGAADQIALFGQCTPGNTVTILGGSCL